MHNRKADRDRASTTGRVGEETSVLNVDIILFSLLYFPQLFFCTLPPTAILKAQLKTDLLMNNIKTLRKYRDSLDGRQE